MPAEAAAILEVEGLSIGFGAMVDIVDGVTLEVGRGETLGLVGESGCGKSITALAVMGLLPSPSSRIEARALRVEGRDLQATSERARADLRGDRLAMIFQEPMTSLNPAFRIGDQIAEGVIRHRGASRAEATARALEMLRRVRMPAAERRLRSYPHELSGGMRQRAMIAMALVNDPALLIADEPTTALDVTIQAQILGLIRSLQEETGTAMLLITHDLGVVAETADRVAVMYAGWIVESGPVEAIFAGPQHPYTLGLMASVPSLGRRSAGLASIAGAVPAPGSMPTGCRFSPRCPFSVRRCIEEPPPPVEIEPGHQVRCWRAPLEAHAAQAA